MPDKANPDRQSAGSRLGSLPRAALPTSDPGAREEWARFIEQLGASFSELYAREMAVLRSNPDDKQTISQATYYKNAVGVVKWLAWRIRAGKLRPLSE